MYHTNTFARPTGGRFTRLDQSRNWAPGPNWDCFQYDPRFSDGRQFSGHMVGRPGANYYPSPFPYGNPNFRNIRHPPPPLPIPSGYSRFACPRQPHSYFHPEQPWFLPAGFQNMPPPPAPLEFCNQYSGSGPGFPFPGNDFQWSEYQPDGSRSMNRYWNDGMTSRRDFPLCNEIPSNSNYTENMVLSNRNPWTTASRVAPTRTNYGYENYCPEQPPCPPPPPPPLPPPVPSEEAPPEPDKPQPVLPPSKSETPPGMPEVEPILSDSNCKTTVVAEEKDSKAANVSKKRSEVSIAETVDWYKTFRWIDPSEDVREPTNLEIKLPNATVPEKSKPVSVSKSKQPVVKKRVRLSKISLHKYPDDKIQPENFGHGRVQNVKLLSGETGSSPSTGSGARGTSSATVSFIDILSASKALRAGPTLSGQPLQITYHEPGSVPSSRGNLPVEPQSSPAGESGVTNNSETSGNSSSNTPTQNQPPQGNSNGPSGGSSGSGSGNSYRQQRFPNQHGPSDDSSSHFYEQPKGFSRGRGDGRGFHGGRGRREHRYHNNRQSFPTERNYRMSSWGYQNEGRFAPPAHSEPDIERASSGPPPSSHPPSTNSESGSKGTRRPDSPASSVSSRHLPSKRNQSRSVSESGSSDRGSSAGSRSRSASHSSASSAGSGRSRSPSHHGSASGNYSNSRGGSSSRRIQSHSFPRQSRYRSRLVSRPADSSRTRHSHSSRSPHMDGGSPSSSSSASSSPSPHRKASTAPQSPSASPSSTKSYSPSRSLNSSHHHQSHSQRRPISSAELNSAIKIRNLPARSSDTSLKDGLYHEYKKHGKVSWVKIVGNGPERYALVCFKSSEHASRAVSLSQEKYFFGCKIQVSPYQGVGGVVGGRGTEEPLGGPGDDDNRYLDDDESFITTSPTRNVLVAGLDHAITVAELEENLCPNGEIVGLEIRKAVGHTYTVCEFVDIASAAKVQWSRLQIKHTRVYFYRSQPSNFILLDGTSGCSEKLLSNQCSQYGAIIKIVMDSGRSMALVQFEEISSAQAALRELRSWMYKGKQCSVDFFPASSLQIFLNRLPYQTGELGNNLHASPDLRSDSATPPLANSGTPSKENGGTVTARRSNGRRFTDYPVERRPHHRHNDVDGISGLRIYNDEGVSPDVSAVSRNGPAIANTLNGGDNVAVGTGSYHSRRRFGPVNSEPENLQNDERGPTGASKRLSSSGSKIDLSCHETDSAVVTSSSDVIVAESTEPGDHLTQHPVILQKHRHNVIHRKSSLVTINGDDRPHGIFENVGGMMSRSSGVWSKSHYVIGAMDGVSSTSPEPKNETVRKASPDPGVGLESVNHGTVTEAPISPVLLDPRIRDSDGKIRRTSADSGNFVNNVKYSPPKPVSVSTGACNSETVPTTPGEDLDDRPGTPLCDENPEHFPSNEAPSGLLSSGVGNQQQTGRPDPPTKSAKTEDHVSLPLPEFVFQRNSSLNIRKGSAGDSGTSNTPKSPNYLSRCSSETSLSKSTGTTPNASVVSTPPSVMTSSASENNLTDKSSSSSTSCLKSTNVTDNTNRSSVQSLGSVRVDNEIKSGLEINHHVQARTDEGTRALEINANCVSPPLSNYDGSPSPPLSPSGKALDLQIASLYERFDQWSSGNRSTGRPNYSTANNIGATEQNGWKDGNSLYPSSGEKPMFSRPKALDFDELRNQPSEITKTLIAKKSIFDEDTKRLENFREKYDAKLPSTCITTANWRQSFANRSSSTNSNSSTSSTPITPTSATSSSGSSVFPSTPTTPGSTFMRSQSHQSFMPGTTTPASPLPVTPRTPLSNSPQNPIVKRKDLMWTPKVDTGSGSSSKTVASPQTPVSPAPPVSSGSKYPSTNSSPNFPPPINRSVSVSGAVSSGKAIVIPEPQSQKSKPLPGVISTIPSTSISVAPQQNADARAKLTTQKSAPGIHQGIPRMVERSMSLDSKRNPTNSVNPTAQSTPSTTASAGSSPNSGINSASTTSTSTTAVTTATTASHSRRTSVDSSAGSSSKEKESVPLPTNQITAGPPKCENEVTRTKIKPIVVEPVKDWKGATLKEIINNSKPTPTLTILSGATNHSKEGTLKFDVIKEDSRLNFQHLQEPTVAVVASIQTPVLTPRTSGNSGSSSSGKDKDSNSVNNKKKDKDSLNNNNSARKRKPSGNSSTPITNNHNGRADPSSSSNKSSKDKEKKPSSSSNGTREKFEHENSTSQHSSGSGSHHNKDKKSEKKDGSLNVAENVNTNSGHVHRKDKESSKAKRRLSSVEAEPDHKRPKVDKEKESTSSELTIPAPPADSHHHRKSTSSTSERRESRDSSSSASKDKHQKEKSHSTKDNSKEDKPDPAPPATPVKDRVEKPDKEHHHRPKSTSSSSSKHHHHEKSEKSSSLSSHSYKDKERLRKDKSSPVVKEKEKDSSSKTPSSKHSSSSHSSHHRSKDKDEKSSVPSTPSASSRSKPKEKEREKEKDRDKIKEKHASTNSRASTAAIDSDDADEIDGGNEKDKRNSSKSKSSSKGKRDRTKSGGDSSGGNDSSKPSSARGKAKEQKKRRRRVIEDTDSSDSNNDDDDKQKHHSIFEVVVDEYVSMYDKVKARSNRACKNVAASKLQHDDQKKPDKVSESFNLLKKSRAKREEKKRSTSVDDRKSMNTTTDDESHTERDQHHDSDEEIQRSRESIHSDREHDRANTTQSSSDDEPSSIISGHKRSSSAKSKSHSSKSKRKDKDSSSKSGRPSSITGSLSGKRSSKKSSKSSPLRSSDFYLGHSDDDALPQPPLIKKRKLGSKHNTPSLTVVSSMSVETSKSTDDSMSEPDDSTARNRFQPALPKPISSKKKHSSKPERKLLSSLEIHSESDSSHTRKLSVSKPKKDKSSKLERFIFDDSGTSDHDEKGLKSRKESSDKSSVRSGKSKDKVGKSSKKKSSTHHSHGSSSGRSGSKTRKRKRDRLSSGDTKSVLSSAEASPSKSISRKEPPSTVEDLFGPMTPMTPSSGSEMGEVQKSPVSVATFPEDRPRAPSPTLSKSFEETPVTSRKSKSGRSRSKPRRNSIPHDQPKVDELASSISQMNNGALDTPPVMLSHVKSSSSAEKKKKKHHKRSKRLESHDSSIRTESVDYDALFSPVGSPEPKKPEVKTSPPQVSPTIVAPLPSTSPSKYTLYTGAEIPLLGLASPMKSKKVEDKIVTDMKSMFSTDEEDDDDEALKIDISIIASGENEEEDQDQPGIIPDPVIPIPIVEVPEEPVVDEEADAAAKLLEEEEKKRNCLFEQDKAIESILHERKSPPRMNMGSLGQIQSQAGLHLDPEDSSKDDLTKDETSISQEETEDAVAALLGSLDHEDDVDEERNTSMGSPPTISIPETSPVHSNTDTEKELLMRSAWFPPSPKDLQIDESESAVSVPNDKVSSVEENASSVDSEVPSIENIAPSNEIRKSSIASSSGESCIDNATVPVENRVLTLPMDSRPTYTTPVDIRTSFMDSRAPTTSVVDHIASSIEHVVSPPKTKLTTEEAVQQLHDLVEEAKLNAQFSSHSQHLQDVLSGATRSRRQSRQGSGSSEHGSSADIYEFHDSDDERRRARAIPGSPGISQLVHTVKPNSTPTRPTPPSSAVPLEIVIDKPATLMMASPPIPAQLSSPKLKLPSPVVSVPVPIKEEPAPEPHVVHVQPPLQSSRLPTLPISSVSPVTRTKTPPTYVRNSVDETIEEVVRGCGGSLPDPEIPPISLPIAPTSRSSPRGRGRSISKDSNDEITATINRVACMDTSPKRTNISMPAPTPSLVEPPVVLGGNGQPKIPIIETRTDSHGPQPPTSSEVLIDPQTGHLTQMMRQSDEGQYIPVAGQEAFKPNHAPGSQPHLFQQQNKPIINKPGLANAGELERAGSIERVQVDSQPFQIQIHKNEGLPAMLAQQQQHTLMLQQKQHQQQQQQDELRRKQQQQYFSQMQQHQAFQQSQSPGPPPVSTPSPIVKSAPVNPYLHGKPGPIATSDPAISSPYLFATNSSPGQSPPARPPVMYGTPPPSHSASMQMPQTPYNQGPLIRPQDPHGSVRLGSPIIRHPAPGQPQHIPSPGQVQAQLVRIPQIPMATTITKVESRSEEHNRMANMIQQQQHPSAVIMTTTSANALGMSGGPHGGSIVRGTTLPPHQLQARVHEGFGSSQGPPRIEISGSMVQSSTPSSMPSRILQQHEQSPSMHGRMPAHMTMEQPMESSSPAPLDLVTQSSHNHSLHARSNSNTNNSSTNSKVHQARQAEGRLVQPVRPTQMDSPHFNPHQQGGYPHHYNIPVSMANMPTTHGQSSNMGYGMRPGSVESMQQGIPTSLDRPPAAHLIPPHLSSPHLGERGAESPHVVPMYSHRQIAVNHGGQGQSHSGQHHSPSIPSAHQQQMRQTFPFPFDYDEAGRGFTRSPGYTIQEREAIQARERDIMSGHGGSPFNANRRGTPPPAHGVPRFGHMADAPPQRRPDSPPPPPRDSSTTPPPDSLLFLLQRYPIMWQGMLALKNDSAACQFHFVAGNMSVARESLPSHQMPDPTYPPLRISQRMRLEPTQLDGVARKLQTENEYAMLLALPCGRDHLDVLQQSNNLRNGFITYLQLKQAAGIVNVHQPEQSAPSYVIHIFPSCDFANENLARIAPDLLGGVADIAHLLIVIATV